MTRYSIFLHVMLCCSTKFLGGHSDLLAGVMTCASLEHWKELLVWRTTLGNTLVCDTILMSETVCAAK